MSKVLLITVGGSLEPLKTSIRTNQPDYIVFICSQDTATKGSYEMVPILLKETDNANLPNEILLVNPDDPEDCLRKLIPKGEELSSKFGFENIYADYTGGTKTMSASLFWTAVRFRFNLCLTTGIRRDLIIVKEGETTRRVPLSYPYYEELLSSLNSLLNKFHYISAEESIRSALANFPFPSQMQEELQRMLDIISSFRLWDAYDSLSAYEKMKPYKKFFWEKYLSFWEKVIVDRALMEDDFKEELEKRKLSISLNKKSEQYAVVQDMILNAERSAVRGRFDDAVARLYRALEAFAQLRLLLKYGIKTSDVDIGIVPQDLKEKYERKRRDGKIRLGLMEDYELLSELGDGVGRDFEGRRDELKREIEKRNQSILAHGFKSISEGEYREVEGKIVGFIKGNLRGILGDRYEEPSQLPRSLEEIEELLGKA